jgi:hypothetical protein
MADALNNTTKQPGPDGLDDATGKPVDEFNQAAVAANGAPAQTAAAVVLMPLDSSYQTGAGATRNDAQLSPTQATAYYARMSGREKARVQMYYDQMGKALGYTNPKAMWGAFVQGSADSGMTPWEVLAYQAGQPRTSGELAAQAKADAGPAGPYLGPSSSTTLSTEFDAKALVDNAVGQYLGRNATEKELQQFHAMLNKQQSAHPDVSTPNGLHDRTVTGGVSAAGASAMADEFAKSRGDYAETQAATTGMAWLNESIRGEQSGKLI